MNINGNEADNNYNKGDLVEPTEEEMLDISMEQQIPKEYIDQRNTDNTDEQGDELSEEKEKAMKLQE